MHKVLVVCLSCLVTTTLSGYDDYDSKEYEKPISEHTIVSHGSDDLQSSYEEDDATFEEPVSDTAFSHKEKTRQQSVIDNHEREIIQHDFYDDGGSAQEDDTLDLLYGDTPNDYVEHATPVEEPEEFAGYEITTEPIVTKKEEDTDTLEIDEESSSSLWGSLLPSSKKKEKKYETIEPQPVEIESEYDDIYDIEEPVEESYTKRVSRAYKVIEPQETQELTQSMDSTYQHSQKKVDPQATLIETKMFQRKQNLDKDEDGVYDRKDMCPNTPLGATVDENGCPLDSDGDGVYDYKDVCKNTPLRAKVDKNGCEIKKVAKKMLKVTFKPKSTRLTYNSFSEILRFSDFLKKYPRYDTQIIAYAVNDRALDLAKKRANAIKEALIIEGIDASRIETSAYSQNRKNADHLLDKTPIEVRIFY